MTNVISDIWEPEDPRKIYDELINRCKLVKEWCIACLVEESWVPPKGFPLEFFLSDGVYYFRVVSMTHREALIKVVEFVPVIKFLDLDDEQ